MFPKTASVIFPVVLVCCVFLTAGVAIAQPPTVVIVVDDSGSMRDRMRIPDGNGGTKRVRRMDVAKDALRDVLNNLPDETIVGLLALNSETDTDNTSIPNSDPMREHWIIPVGPLDKSKLRSRINKIRANGGTPLGAALKSASDELIRRRWENVYGEYRMLIVTDGEANDNDKLNSNLPSALGRGLVVDVIGVDMKSQHSLATRVHRYRSAADPESLQLAMREVFAEADTAVDEDVTVVANASGDEGETEEQRPPNDFEMIEGLPDEIAIAAIESLS
ncbi:MAG: VWA domain-containing protein, partial [Planctomycetota bacterium]